jgi:hypothetical protein
MSNDSLALDVLVEFLNAVEAGVTAAKQQLKEKKGIKPAEHVAVVQEETFSTLAFEPHKSAKLGDYEVAFKANNIPEKWVHAYAVLRQNNATISSRYRGPNYAHSYWIYGADKIYRQKPKLT